MDRRNYREQPQVPTEESDISSLNRSDSQSSESGQSSQSQVRSDRGIGSPIIEEQFWQEDPIRENEDPNFGRGAGGPPAGEAPPPYPGNGQGNQDQNNLLQLIQGLIQVQQTQQQAQVENNINFQQAHNALGNEIRALAQVVEQMNQNRQHEVRHHHQPGADARTFKPNMFRPLDMKAVNKDNKLLSEEFMNWQMNITRVLQANPAAAALPVQRLTALILAGIGEKAERRLTGLGHNPTFHSLEEFFNKLKSIFCSSTIQTDAEEQFQKAKQYPNEDLNSWHARCLLYFRLAFPTQDYWNILLKRFFQGMSNRKLAEKTLDNISNRPGGWEALCNQEGYEVCLKLTVKCEAFAGFKSHLLNDKTSHYKSYDRSDSSVPMDTSSVQNRSYHRNQKPSRNTTATVNFPNNGQKQSSSTGANPPAGMQKKLQQQARNQRSNYQARDKSKDKCLKCDKVGHWARECTVGATESMNSTPMTIVPENQNWSDINIVSTISSSNEDWPSLSANCVCNPN